MNKNNLYKFQQHFNSLQLISHQSEHHEHCDDKIVNKITLISIYIIYIASCYETPVSAVCSEFFISQMMTDYELNNQTVTVIDVTSPWWTRRSIQCSLTQLAADRVFSTWHSAKRSHDCSVPITSSSPKERSWMKINSVVPAFNGNNLGLGRRLQAFVD